MQRQLLVQRTAIALISSLILFPTQTYAGSSPAGGVTPDSGVTGQPFGSGQVPTSGWSLGLLNAILQAASAGGRTVVTVANVPDAAAPATGRVRDNGSTMTVSLGTRSITLSDDLVSAFLALASGNSVGGISTAQAIPIIRAAFLDIGVALDDVDALINDLRGLIAIGIEAEVDAASNPHSAELLLASRISLPDSLKLAEVGLAQLSIKSQLNDQRSNLKVTKQAERLAQLNSSALSLQIVSVDPLKLEESIEAFNAIVIDSDQATLAAIKADANLMFIRNALNTLADAVVNRQIAVGPSLIEQEPLPVLETQAPDGSEAIVLAQPEPPVYGEALKVATTASQLAQTATSIADWNQVASAWQTAIELMDMVLPSSPNYGAAQTNIQSYRRSLGAAQQQADPFYQAVTTATAAAELVQVANSRQDWELAASKWQRALELMRIVPQTYPRYNVAQNRVGVYQRNLDYARQQIARLS